MAYHHMGQTDHSFCPLPLRKKWAASNTVSWMFFPVILHQLRPPSPIRLVYKCPLTGAWQFSTWRLGNCKAQCWCLQGLLGNFQSAWHMIIGPKGQSKHTTHHTSSHYNCCLLAILQSVSLHKARWDISTPSPPLCLPYGIWFFYICRGSEIYLGPISPSRIGPGKMQFVSWVTVSNNRDLWERVSTSEIPKEEKVLHWE